MDKLQGSEASNIGDHELVIVFDCRLTVHCLESRCMLIVADSSSCPGTIRTSPTNVALKGSYCSVDEPAAGR